MKYKIKERSALAYLAALRLGHKKIALVLGSVIYLSGVSKIEFLSNEAWLRHELEHVRQFRRYGFTKFLLLYLLESIRKGYHNNRFEIQARAAENNRPNAG